MVVLGSERPVMNMSVPLHPSPGPRTHLLFGDQAPRHPEWSTLAFWYPVAPKSVGVSLGRERGLENG